jgi:hypothetical protein
MSPYAFHEEVLQHELLDVRAQHPVHRLRATYGLRRLPLGYMYACFYTYFFSLTVLIKRHLAQGLNFTFPHGQGQNRPI